MIKVRYVGKSHFTDHVTGREWAPKETDLVEPADAVRLIELHEFADARHWTQRDKPILDAAPPVKKVEPEIEVKANVRRIEGVKRVFEEDDQNEAPLVNLQAMTKESLTMYVHRNFGVEMSERMTKDEMITKARDYMGGAPRHI